jgi:hypothetical protein
MDALLTFRTYVRILYVSNRKVVLDMGELKEKIIELIENCMDEDDLRTIYAFIKRFLR